jgi:hypothetical protein
MTNSSMSALEDILEAVFHVGVIATAHSVRQGSQKSFADASDRNDFWGMLFSAVLRGGSVYAHVWSAQNLNRLAGKYRSLPQKF